jgi:hypothetical protein
LALSSVSLTQSIFERDSDEIVPAPDQPTFADGAKIIERQLKIRRQYVEAIQPDLSADIGDVPRFASKYTALGAKEQQHAL